MTRSVILWTLAAIAGVVLVAGVTYAASGLSSQTIGLSSEPLGAGRGPRARRDPVAGHDRRRPRRGPQARRGPPPRGRPPRPGPRRAPHSAGPRARGATPVGGARPSRRRSRRPPRRRSTTTTRARAPTTRAAAAAAGAAAAATTTRARRPADPAEQVRAEARLGVALGLGVAERRVPGPAAVEAAAPRDRVPRAHRAARVGGLVEQRQHAHAAPRLGAEVVPLVRATASAAAAARVEGWRRSTTRIVAGWTAGWRAEARAEQAAVPAPAVLRVGRGVHAREAAAAPDVAAERGLLGGVEHVARGAQEDHHGVAAQPPVRERSAASSVARRRANPWRAPSARTAATPAGIESCRNALRRAEHEHPDRAPRRAPGRDASGPAARRPGTRTMPQSAAQIALMPRRRASNISVSPTEI